MPVFVVTTTAVFLIQVTTNYRGIKYFRGFSIFELVQATTGTSIAQTLPFLSAHLGH